MNSARVFYTQTINALLQVIGVFAFMQFVLDESRAFSGNGLFVWLGIIVICSVHRAVTVAYEPNLSVVSAVNHGTCRGAFCWHGTHPVYIITVFCIYPVYGICYTFAEFFHACLCRHAVNECLDCFHAEASVAHTAVDACGSFTCASVYYGYKSIVYRYSVFALLLCPFSYYCFLYDFHYTVLWA